MHKLTGLIPELRPAHIALYVGVFVLLQAVYVCTEAQPDALRKQKRLSARLLFAFAFSIALPCAGLVFALTYGLLSKCPCH